MSDWRYIATTLNGDGTETLIDGDLPLVDVSITQSLSAPDSIQAKLAPEHLYLKGSAGQPVLLPWATAIYAEKDGLIRHGSIVTKLESDNSELGISTMGFSAYINEMPWIGEVLKFYDVDPAYIIRLVWNRVQAFPHGNIGLQVPVFTTPVRLGVKVPAITNSAGDVQEEAKDEPLLLADYATADLGKLIESIMAVSSIEYRESHVWDGDGEGIKHSLSVGYPRLGARRQDLQLVVGANVSAVPTVSISAGDYASEVLLYGMGEGPTMVRAVGRNPSVNRLRRVGIQIAKHIGRQDSANKAAQNRALQMNQYATDIDTLVVRDSDMAPIAALTPGDDVYVTGFSGWAGDIAMWVRIISVTFNPGTESSTATLAVVRSDKG